MRNKGQIAINQTEQQNQQYISYRPQSNANLIQVLKIVGVVVLFILLACLIVAVIISCQPLINSSYHYVLNNLSLRSSCQIPQSMPHYVTSRNQHQSSKVYYQTNYAIFLPACPQIQRSSIKQWWTQRTIIQWVKLNVFQDAHVLYDLNDRRNYEEIVIISLLVGKRGKVTVTSTLNQECLQQIQILYGYLNNIAIDTPKPRLFYQNQIIITSNQNYLKQFLNSIRKQKIDGKRILFTVPQDQNLYQQLFTIVKDKELSFSSIILKKECNSELETRKLQNNNIQQLYNNNIQQMKNQYYEIKKQDSNISLPPILQIQNKLKKLNQKKQYQEDINFRQKIISQSQQSLSNQQYQGIKQIIQWVKIRIKNNSTIFYNYMYENINIPTIKYIAKSIQQGNLLINCSERQRSKMLEQIQKDQTKNIIFINKSQELTIKNYDLAITDNFNLLKDISLANQKFILGYFTQESINVLYELYTKYQIKKVKISQEREKNQILYHFLQYSQDPSGFFDIGYNKHVIYVYWSNNLSTLISNPNRYANLKQSIRINTPEVKVIHKKILPYFQLPQAKFHDGFYHLSPTHRSDYIRGYLMHYYGGGYMDIKHIQFDWEPYFLQLQESPSHIYAIGYQEMSNGDVSCYQVKDKAPCEQIQQKYKQLIGNGQYIYKKQNKMTQEWVKRMHDTLDKNYEVLKKIPEEYGSDSNYRDIKKIPNYPLRWGEMGGSIIQRIQYQNLGHVYTNLPTVIMDDYK